MGISYLIAILLATLPNVSAFSHFSDVRKVFGPRSVPLTGISLIATFGLQTYLYDLAVLTQKPIFVTSLPMRFFPIHPFQRPNQFTADSELGLALLEVVLLGAFVIGVGTLGRRTYAAAVGACASAILIVALASHSGDSPDPYSYLGLSMLGAKAYAPPSTPFPGEFAIINRIWGQPIPPSLYGPLFLLIVHVTTLPALTVAGKLFALKVLGAVSLLTCGLLTRAFGLSRPVVAAILCNPALASIYVTSAHNDLLAVDCALGSLVAARRGNVALSVLLGTCAGFIKSTMTLVALIAAASFAQLGRRLLFAAATIALVVVGYFAFASNYLAAVQRVSALNPPSYHPFELLLQLVAVSLAFVTVVRAVLFARVEARAAWTFIALGQYPVLQYLSWGLPCAIAAEPTALAFLVSLPFASFALAPLYQSTPTFTIVRGILVYGLLAAEAFGFQRRRLAQRTP